MLCYNIGKDDRSTCLHHFPGSTKSFKTTCYQYSEIILIPLGGHHNGGSLTWSDCVCGPPSHHFIPPRSTATSGVHLGWQVVPSACMESPMQHYQTAGFSQAVSRLAAAPRRPSNNRMYENWWFCFAHWATGQGTDLLGHTAAQIATLLYIPLWYSCSIASNAQRLQDLLSLKRQWFRTELFQIRFLV